MTRAPAEPLRDALGLPQRERLDLAAELLASVDGPPDADWNEAWAAELDRREADIDRSGDTGDDWTEVRSRVLSRLGRP